MDIETQRLENLRQKQKLLADLKLESSSDLRATRVKKEDADVERSRPSKKRKVGVQAAPSRISARLAASGDRPSYREDPGDCYNYITAEPKKKKTETQRAGRKPLAVLEDSKTPSDARTLVPIADVDEICHGWTQWEAVGAPPTRDAHAVFHFDDFPRFTPNKSPEEMLREGAFGGSYFRPLKSRKLGVMVEDDWQELPPQWLEGLAVDRYLTNPHYDPDANKFKVACGQSIEEWEAAGWINHYYDVRGWFQWYIRFWMGRRCEDDDRQVSRWAKCVGKSGRWRRLLLKKYVQMGVREIDEHDYEDEEEVKEVSPVMHQTCHHWAFEVRQTDLDEAWAGFG